MVFAHVLNLTQHVGDHSRTAREGKWTASPDFCYWDYPLIELAGKTMGIIGLGRIGQATAKLAAAFGMNVIAYTRNPEACIAAGVSPATLDELLASSDVVSLHCPLTDETQGMINAARLAKMKPSAFLINTSRGPLIDQQALADALNEGRLAGAGLDVMCAEPPPADNPLLSAKNCCITPHIAWATKEARQRLMATTIENIKAFQNAAPQNVVNAR
jgi:glycerate dehydrogenase